MAKVTPNYGMYAYIDGFLPEWYISTMICSRDVPFWSENLDYICLYVHICIHAFAYISVYVCTYVCI